MALRKAQLPFGTDASEPEARERVDGAELDLIPGLVDTHMHLILPAMGLEETIRSETSAAVGGGVTTVIHLVSAPGRLPEARAQFVERYEGVGLTDLNPSTALVTYEDVDSVRELADAGVARMKFLSL